MIEHFVHTEKGYCYYDLENSFIYNLYTEPEYRRTGVATRLLLCIIAEMKKAGCNGDIFIEVEPRENSISSDDLSNFYKNMGLIIKPRR